MIRAFLQWTGFIALFSLLSACDNRSAGDPSSVETQNSVAGIIRSSDGNSAAGVHISVYLASQVGGAPVAEGITDSSGAYWVAVPDSRPYSIEAMSDSGFVARVLQAGDTSVEESQVLVLRKPLQIHLMLSPSSDWPLESTVVNLFGSSQTWNWNPTEVLAWSVPDSGFYALQFRAGTTLSEQVVHIQEDDDTILIAPSTQRSALVTNFDNDCTRSDLGYLYGSGWTFALEDWNSDIQHIADGEENLCEIDPERDQTLHIQWAPSAESSWMDVGLGLGYRDTPMDLSQVDSIVFWAKGTGTLFLEVVTANTPQNSYDEYATFPAFPLDTDWSRYSISTEQLQFPAGSQADSLGITWEESSSQVLFLQWSSADSVEFWLDEIRFSGANISDL